MVKSNKGISIIESLVCIVIIELGLSQLCSFQPLQLIQWTVRLKEINLLSIRDGNGRYDC